MPGDRLASLGLAVLSDPVRLVDGRSWHLDVAGRHPGPSFDGAPLWKRLAWFTGLRAAIVAALGIVAYGLRALILP